MTDKTAHLLQLNRGAELVAQLEDVLGANAVWDALVQQTRHRIRIGARSTDPLGLADALEEMAAELRGVAREQATEAEAVRRQLESDVAAIYGEDAAAGQEEPR
ncbi:hypothetical protein [Gordonia sp. MP11Mi]|uniref:Uncharacterized protein n=1 Tax=Gordonia sp. MP11Mi TaxID=3022769 RepID=A0AA97CZP9_9ACTN